MGLMGPMGPMGPIGLIGLIGLMGLCGCSEGYEQERGQHVVLEAQLCTSAYDEVLSADDARTMSPNSSVTRAWLPPTGYASYYEAYVGKFAEQANLFHKSIGVYLTQDTQTPQEGTFFYNGNVTTDSKWRFESDLELKTDTYYLYGYIPKEVAESSSIVANSSFENGAVLSIYGLKTVTHSDVSVVVGAKNGTADSDGGVTTGTFAVDANATSKDISSGNHIYLLFDHLYSALRFRFRVAETYAALRTIKLTKLELTANESLGSTRLKAKYNATIRLAANTTGASPIQSIVFTPDNSSADQAYEPIYSGSEVELPSAAGKYTSFMGCFVPGQNTSFYLRSTYNVYDLKGNLVREGCEAVNTIDLRSLFKITATQLQRGHMYSVTLTVNPTYLYVLSEPDLDNPTVKIN